MCASGRTTSASDRAARHDEGRFLKKCNGPSQSGRPRDLDNLTRKPPPSPLRERIVENHPLCENGWTTFYSTSTHGPSQR
jgi:hypothetical protein